MQLHFLDDARLVIDVDFLEVRHEIDLLQWIVVRPGVGVTLGGALMVVEGDAGREHVQHRRAAVTERRLQDG